MKHTFPIKDVLNITTGQLYTPMDNIYEFFNKVIEPGMFTHMLPNAREAILPILKRKNEFKTVKFEGFDPNIPNVDFSFEFNEGDKAEFWKNYEALPSPFSKR